MSFSVNRLDMMRGLAEASIKLEVAGKLLADTGAVKMQGYAQRKAKWTDRTGSARQRLSAKAEVIPSGFKITLAHGVEYGIWLELAHEKRFAIIEQSLVEVGQKKIMPAFSKLMAGTRL